ncbi:thiol-disulfide oxidoreductase DCC family protein [Conexibacter sp. SYSU D00693]|uniref:thiol-disulfide oxidoreductase DCC family protein n=1 Tax=Conexibacter sp. SYSU D00693 TaxID=2812560 RepID=UPI00196BA328|nr:DUF393 domain-containing protein [Conexibacter sp. SYSU D00693]
MLVLWDRDCGFCAFVLTTLLRADRRGEVRVATIQSPEGQRLLADLPPERRLASWHVVLDDGRRLSGGEALTAALRELGPATRPLGALTGAMPGVTDRSYRWVAGHRRLLSRPIPRALKERARDQLARR